MINPFSDETIVALSTPPGTGAIATFRLSGKDTFSICKNIFRGKKSKSFDISKIKSHTIHHGEIFRDDVLVDEVVLSIFKAPNSYTGEDIAEISCHGSQFIQQQILQLIIQQGARLATAGEFTFRAFRNGKFDLSQAEAVADLIASHSETSHKFAMQQMRGGFSGKIKILRDNLINFASLLELELDFSEEDVEFASKAELKKLISSLQSTIHELIRSFELGNVIKNGIPVCIVGKPNAGKSTLLNALLEEERAIVSDIPGTTRDTIEDEMVIDGMRFRFIDTAGIRHATDTLETAGIERTYNAIRQSSVVIYLFDAEQLIIKDLQKEIEAIHKHSGEAKFFSVANKIDISDETIIRKKFSGFNDIIFISAKEKKGIEEFKKILAEHFKNQVGIAPETIVTNSRHAEALRNAEDALQRVNEGLEKKLSGELLASDIRIALHHLGLITGEISTNDLLQNIFSRFCIGK